MSQSDFVIRGQALVSAGQYQEAVKVCRLGLLGRPTTVEGRVVLGQALLALKRFDEVLAEMRVALELDHTSITAQTLKAEALLRKGDAHAAAEILQKLRAAGEPRIASLLDEAERAIGRPRTSAVHPAVGFVSPASAPNKPGELRTRAYLPHAADEEDTDDNADEDTGGSFTRPTSLAAPKSPQRSRERPAQVAADATPPPAVLAVGDRSGTVEVDPELDGVEVGDEDFADLAAPPLVRGAKRPKPLEGARGAVMAASRSPEPAQSVKKKSVAKFQKEVSTVELADDEMIELEETQDPVPLKRPGPGTAVRNAVKMPSGPLDVRASEAASRPTMHQPVPAPPPHLAHLIANHGHAPLPPPQPLPPPPNVRGPIAAALPTAAAMVPPAPVNPYARTMLPQPMPVAPYAQPTLALTPPQQQTAAAVDAMFEDPAPAWAQPAAPMGSVDSVPPIAPHDSVNQSGAKPMKTGVRRGRSRFQIALWVLLGALVIGGGVFAGFQIRAMRLAKQITAAREQAVALAKADTWRGWVGARDRLAGIAQASATADNRAALARARALVAFEFGDGFAEAKTAVEQLAGAGGFDGKLAAAYLALASSDAKSARTAADEAGAADDPAVLYVTGQAQLLAGDLKLAIASLKSALEKDARPLYAVGLARAYAAASQWDEALAAADKALALAPDHPGALVERAMLLAASGRVIPTTTLGSELRAQLEKVVAEGAKPPAEQPRGVSPAQVAFADLALARIDYARGDLNAAQADIRNALAIGLDEQRFAEEVVDTLYATGSVPAARTAAERVLAQWPTSRRARTALAEILLAQGMIVEALDLFSKTSELAQYPRALVVRGQAQLARGDAEAARADFDAALAKAPSLEPALVGRAWLDLESKDVDAARKRIEPRFNPATATPAMAAVYAAILRASDEPGARDKARAILEKAVVGPPSLDVARANLELARIYRDAGETRAARKAYEEAMRLPAARLESALLLIEDRDPNGGRETLEKLLEEAGDKAPGNLLVETARARMLVGDHTGADALLQRADKAPDVVRWQLERERGRLALRKADYAGAAQALGRAIEECGSDHETFLLSADTASDGKQQRLLDKVKALAPKKLAGRPELHIVNGKLALADGDYDGAGKAYETAGKAFEAAKATPRRSAQANFGRAVSAYFRKDDPNARNALDLVIEQDPSIFAAYLYLGDMVRDKDPKRALELAQKAVTYNPDLVEGWVMLGSVASRLRNRKLLAEAITRVGELAPNSEALSLLQSL